MEETQARRRDTTFVFPVPVACLVSTRNQVSSNIEGTIAFDESYFNKSVGFLAPTTSYK